MKIIYLYYKFRNLISIKIPKYKVYLRTHCRKEKRDFLGGICRIKTFCFYNI